MAPAPVNSRSVNALLFACPLTASFSSSFGAISFAGQSLYPFKVVVPVLAITLGRRTVDVLTHPGSYPFILALLAGWGFVALSWTPDRVGGLKEVSILAFAALAASAIAIAVRTPDGVRWLLRGWLTGVAVDNTGRTMGAQHWATSRVLEFAAERDGIPAGLLLSTFGNPNNFGAFLVISLPFVAIVATVPRSVWGLSWADRVLARILLVVLPLTLVLSGSRFALIGALIACGVYIALNRRDRSAWRFGGLLALFGAALSVIAISTGQQIAEKVANINAPSAFVQSSAEIRLNLILNGLSYLGRTGGVGIGPAGFEQSIASGDVAFPVRRGVVNAHNFWIELLSQYGILGGLLLGLVIVSAATSYTHTMRTRPYGTDRQLATLMLAGICGYVFASMTASSYINAPENWMFIASFLAIAPVVLALGGDHPTRTSPTDRPAPPDSRGR